MDYFFNFLMLYIGFFIVDIIIVILYFLVIKKQILKKRYNLTKPNSEEEQNVIYAMDYYLGKQLMGFMYGIAVIPFSALFLGPIVFYDLAVGHEALATSFLIILTNIILPILYVMLIEKIVAMPQLTPEIANQTVEVLALKKQLDCEMDEKNRSEIYRNIVLEEFRLREMIKANSKKEDSDPIKNK